MSASVGELKKVLDEFGDGVETALRGRPAPLATAPLTRQATGA